MFIKINSVNYYILDAQDKSPHEIFVEIFQRMGQNYISKKDKKQLIFEIAHQIHS